jgi:hypothetical protein
MKKVLLVFVLFFTLGGISKSEALSCASWGLNEYFKASEFIFKGKVIGTASTPIRVDATAPRFITPSPPDFHQFVIFEVETIWKGDPKRWVTIHEYTLENIPPYQLGKTYLIYGEETIGVLDGGEEKILTGNAESGCGWPGDAYDSPNPFFKEILQYLSKRSNLNFSTSLEKWVKSNPK